MQFIDSRRRRINQNWTKTQAKLHKNPVNHKFHPKSKNRSKMATQSKLVHFPDSQIQMIDDIGDISASIFLNA